MARPAQKDIAKRLGISQTAVSAVLNNNSAIKVSEKTRQRVLEEAERAGYWPNRAASALLSRKTKTIGVIHLTSFLQTHLEKIFKVVAAIQEAGYMPLIQELVHDRSDDSICQYLRDMHVDGIIVITAPDTFMKQSFERYIRGHIPTVCIDQPGSVNLPLFNSDRRQGFRLVGEHLVSLGYRKIAICCATPPETPHATLSHSYGIIHGVTEALDAAGLKPEAILQYQNTVINRTDPYRAGLEVARRLFQEGHRPEAIVCSNDSWAIGAMTECLRRGMRIPDDVAITGFHNEVQSLYTPSPLTTVGNHIDRLARKAVRHLTDWLEQTDSPQLPASVNLQECELVVRESCGAKLRAPQSV